MPSNKNNNIVWEVIADLRKEIDALIDKHLTSDMRTDGLFEIGTNEAESAKTLKHFNNLVTCIENAILYYEEFNKSNAGIFAYPPLAKKLVYLIDPLKKNSKPVIKNNIFEDTIEEILPAIREESDYQLGIALVKALDTILKEDNPFEFLVQLAQESLISNFFLLLNQQFTLQNIKKVLHEKTILETKLTIGLQLDRSPYLTRIINELDAHEKTITQIFTEYEKTSCDLKKRFIANILAKRKLIKLKESYASLPDQLTLSSGDPLDVKTKLEALSNEKLDRLRTDRSSHITLLKQEYEKKIQILISPIPTIAAQPDETIIAQLKDHITLLENAKKNYRYAISSDRFFGKN